MQTKYLSILGATAAAAASVSTRDVKHVDVVHIFQTLHVTNQVPNFTPNKRSINALFARDSNDKCQSSATSILRTFPTPTGSLRNYLNAAETPRDSCTLEVPSSISSDLMSYYTTLVNWEMDKGDDLVKFVQNCASQDDLDEINKELGGSECSVLGTIIFTAASTTKTVNIETAFPNYTPITLPTAVNDAGFARGISKFAAAAAAGVAGFMMAA
ncbi:hypothetical protein FVEN_g5825 [Fusarium venenatum]|uniref:Infection structure specific protein n=1 Tax=Fusarium venenatum TaxID=56646 RepID=A0A2L2TB36_9HYPO|nr:uncharacterized protein FVRRES_03780 [Fusarium venenatum]KAG8356603.1 hypothetical protein FVEN_g5825 [Fusarium venenatum]KAH7003222.1 hypothetical protein EDB82DRAFT_9203 [Fusarium venenatum]CEI67268.1 unnamed protein product [Fusarium venenatum]